MLGFGVTGYYLLQRAARLPKTLVCSTASNDNHEEPLELFFLPASEHTTDATFFVMGLTSGTDSDIYVYSDIQDLIQGEEQDYANAEMIKSIRGMQTL